MGTLFKLAALVIAVLSFVPAYQQIKNYILLSQRDPDYFHSPSVATAQVKALFIFLIGLAVAYLLFRVGSYFQARRNSKP